MKNLEEVCPSTAEGCVPDPVETGGLIETLVAHAFFEEAIITRIAKAVAEGEGAKDKVFALAVELIAHRNE